MHALGARRQCGIRHVEAGHREGIGSFDTAVGLIVEEVPMARKASAQDAVAPVLHAVDQELGARRCGLGDCRIHDAGAGRACGGRTCGADRRPATPP